VNSLIDPRPDDVQWPRMSEPSIDTILQGSWIQLMPVRPIDDAPELFDALDTDEVWTHLYGRPRSPEELAQSLQTRLDEGSLPWIVRAVDDRVGVPTDTIVGMTSYLDISALDARLEIGWTAYAPKVWSTQVNPECKLLLLSHAFDELGAGRVQLKTDIRNIRSQRAIAGIGAHFEGVLRRYQRRSDDTIRDTALFSVIAEDWPVVRQHLHSRLS